MDTYMIELNSIIESFKLDMFITEHDNFMNILYSRSEGVVNEAVLLELKISKTKLIFHKIQDVFKKFIQKVKEMIEKLKKAIQSKFFSLAFNDLKQLPDDIELGEFIDIKWVQNTIYPRYKNYIKKFQQICDQISKIDTYFIADTPDLNNIKKLYDEIKGYRLDLEDILNYEVFNKSSGIISLTSYNGKYVKENYPKILTIIKEGFKYNSDFGVKLYKSLSKADKHLDNVGKRYTYVDVFDDNDRKYKPTNLSDFKGNMISNDIRSYDHSIHSKEYEPYNGDHMTDEFAIEYINLYADLCKGLASCSRFMFHIVDNCKDIIGKSLYELRERGIKTKSHSGYPWAEDDFDPEIDNPKYW